MPTPDFRGHTILQWDTQAMVKRAGGVAALRKLLAENGFPVPRSQTGYMWGSRRVPHVWVPMIVFILLKTNKAKLSELLKKVDVPAGRPRAAA